MVYQALSLGEFVDLFMRDIANLYQMFNSIQHLVKAHFPEQTNTEVSVYRENSNPRLLIGNKISHIGFYRMISCRNFLYFIFVFEQ